MRYHFEEPLIEERAGHSSVKVTIPGLENTQAAGPPRVPVKPASLLLPQQTRVDTIEVQPGDKHLLGQGYMIERGNPVVPLRSVETASAPHDTGYPVGTYPEKAFEKVGVHTLKGYRILVLRLFPVQYTAASGELFYIYQNTPQLAVGMICKSPANQ